MPRAERSWRAIVQRYLKSGESLGAYCRRRRLNYSSTYYWVRKVREEEEQRKPGGSEVLLGVPPPPTSFVELVAPPIAKDSQEYRLVLNNGRELILKAGFMPATVQALIEVCESC